MGGGGFPSHSNGGCSMRQLALSAVLLSLVAAARAEAQEYVVDGKESSVIYHLVHKFHKIDGVSKKVAGRARLAGPQTQVVVTVPAESFDSGNVNRDAHMKESVEAARFPTIE